MMRVTWLVSTLVLLCGSAAEAFLCMCSPESCVMIHPNTVLLEAVDHYCPIKRTEARDVSIIRLQATMFPKAVFKNFPNMTSLELFQGSLTELEPGTFDGAAKLAKLMIKSNNFTNLGDNVFQGADNIKDLILSSNPVESVSENTFRNLRDLELLILTYGKLKSLPKQLLHNNRLLKTIAFSHNKISFVDSEMFNGLNELEKVDLSSNELTSFDHGLLKAAVIALNNNSLEHLLINQYYTSVEANNNKIRAVWVDGNKVERLDLLNNQISELGNITKLTKLVSLSLGRNTLPPNSVFSEFTELEELILQSTYIKLTRETFDNLKQLKILDLSYNNLTDIDFKIFVSQLSLQVLSFVGNQIPSFNYREAKEYLPKLRVLEICKNGWNRTYLEQNIDGMRKMHISPDLHGFASHFLFRSDYVDMCTEYVNVHDDYDYIEPDVSAVEESLMKEFSAEQVPDPPTSTTTVSASTNTPRSNAIEPDVVSSTDKHHVSEYNTKVAVGISPISDKPKEEKGASPVFIVFQVIAYIFSVVGLVALIVVAYLWKKQRGCLQRISVRSGEGAEYDGDRLI